MRTNLMVTGVAGFVGCHLARAAIDQGFRVVGVDSFAYSGLRENLDDLAGRERFDFEEADIRDGAAMRRIIGRHRPDIVLNLAAQTHVDRSNRDGTPFFDVNVTGCATLLEAFRSHLAAAGGPTRASLFIQVSTDEVFGSRSPEEPADAEAAYRPTSPYAASKAGADLAVLSMHRTHGLPVAITYCTNNFGPRQFPEKLIPLVVARALDGERIPIYGDGGQRRDWLHVADHCAGLLAVAGSGRPGARYLFAGGNTLGNLSVVHMICDHLDATAPRPDRRSYRDQIRHVADRAGHDPCYALDDSDTRRRLGWSTRTDFAAALAETVDWYVANPDWRRVATARQADPAARGPRRLRGAAP